MATNAPTYSLIMVACDHLEQTVSCVNSLARTVDEQSELILVDNGSVDGTRGYLGEIAGRLPCRTEQVLFDENRGWCRGVNAGLERARGDYLVLLNNDLLFTAGWLEGLRQCMDHAHEQLEGFGPAGLVGPVSNRVGGPQRVSVPRDYDPANLEGVAEVFRGQRADAWRPSFFLSGFCLMMGRACLADVGGLDEAFSPGGFDDNDLVLRAQEQGWTCYIAGDVFVHHQGHATFDTHHPELRRGLANQQRFYDKWRQRREGPRRLVAVYRVKDCAATIQQSLDATASFADQICVLDDGSTDETSRICREHPAVTRYEFQQLPFDERRDRNRLLQLAGDLSPDWVISVDGDELFELSRPRAERLMHLTDPHVKVLGFHWYTFWEPTHEYFRADGIFGGMSGMRMFRWEPGQRIQLGTPEGLHCGNIPQFPEGAQRFTSTRVRHLGYDSAPLRQAKFEFYRDLDHDPDPRLVGAADYSHLISDTVTLRRLAPEHGVSLCIITRNEETALLQFLAFWEPFVDQICVTDTGSADGTVAIAEQFTDCVERLDDEQMDLARARNRSLKMATQPWILSLDPDEEMSPADLPALHRLTDDDPCHAYSFRVVNHQKEGAPILSSAVRLFRNSEQIYYSRPVHETVEESLRALPNAVLKLSEIPIQHLGYLKPDDEVQRKLDDYFICNKRYQQENPDDPMTYYNEALHHLNEGHEAQAVEHLEQAMTRDRAFLSARSQLAYVHQERAIRLWREILDIAPVGHPLRADAEQALQILGQVTPHRPRVGVFRTRDRR